MRLKGDSLDNGINDHETVASKTIVKDTLHLLSVFEEEKLINGFVPIKELIYEIRDLKNYKTNQRLANAKIHSHGIVFPI